MPIQLIDKIEPLPRGRRTDVLSPPQHKVYARQYRDQITCLNCADILDEVATINRHNLRDVGNGVVRQPRRIGSQQDITRSASKAEIPRQRYADDCGDSAAIESVTLNHQYRAWIAWF